MTDGERSFRGTSLSGRVLPELREVEGVLASPEVAEVMQRARTSSRSLAARYQNDRSGAGPTELIGYRLSSETGPDTETCVHVAFDPELVRVVIYEEW